MTNVIIRDIPEDEANELIDWLSESQGLWAEEIQDGDFV